MFRSLKQEWQDIKSAKPGTRFQNRYERREDRRCSPSVKPFYLTLGAALFVIGLVLMPAPGPGFIVVFMGAGMLADESLLAARAFDWTELRLRALVSRTERVWKHASAAAKALIAIFAASLAGVAALVGYTLFFA